MIKNGGASSSSQASEEEADSSTSSGILSSTPHGSEASDSGGPDLDYDQPSRQRIRESPKRVDKQNDSIIDQLQNLSDTQILTASDIQPNKTAKASPKGAISDLQRSFDEERIDLIRAHQKEIEDIKQKHSQKVKMLIEESKEKIEQLKRQQIEEARAQLTEVIEGFERAKRKEVELREQHFQRSTTENGNFSLKKPQNLSISKPLALSIVEDELKSETASQLNEKIALSFNKLEESQEYFGREIDALRDDLRNSELRFHKQSLNTAKLIHSSANALDAALKSGSSFLTPQPKKYPQEAEDWLKKFRKERQSAVAEQKRLRRIFASNQDFGG